VADRDAPVDAPASVAPGPSVDIARPDHDLLQTLAVPQPQRRPHVGLAAGALTGKRDDDVRDLMRVAEQGAMLCAHLLDETATAAAVEALELRQSVVVPYAATELDVDPVHCAAIAIDKIGDLLAVRHFAQHISVAHRSLPSAMHR